MRDQYNRIQTITPSDTNQLNGVKAFMVGSGGTMHIDCRAMIGAGSSGSGLDIKINVNAGEIYPIQVDKVRATGCSAGSIIGLA